MATTYKNRKRRKAFIGALIGAVAGLAGSAISSAVSNNKQKAAQEEAEREQELYNDYQQDVQAANNLNVNAESARDYRRAFRNQFMRCGGKRKADFGTELLAALPGITSGASSVITSTMSNPAAAVGLSGAANIAAGLIGNRVQNKLAQRQNAAANIDSKNVIDATVTGRYGCRKKKCFGSKLIR